MREIEPPFEIDYNGKGVRVTEHDIKGQRIFYIDFKGEGKPLTITVGLTAWDKKFWTSIPEGRQAEAEEIGKLITQYIRSKR